MRIESRFAVAISAEVGLRVGLPRHMQNQFFVHVVYSDRSLGSDCVHCASGNHPHFTTLFHNLSTLRWCRWSNMCYLRQPKALCVHCSDVTLRGLDELCSSALLWLCLTASRFIPTCSAPDMVWTWHVCSSACMVLSHWCHTVCCVDISTIQMQSVINLLIFGIKKWI